MSFYEESSIVITPNAYKAGTLYAVSPTSGLADMDFTRATAATRVDEDGLVADVLSGVPRIDYTGGGCPHILAEPQRTNTILYSEEFGSTGWSFVTAGSVIAPIVTNDYAISPDGTQNAQRIQFNLNGGTVSADRTVIRQGVGSQTDWFFSVWMKSTNGSNQKILWHTTSDSNETTITSEWQRFTLNLNATSDYWIGLGLRGGTSTVDTADILVYGFQAEQGSYPTSYIPTSGATVTRNQDQFTRDGISSLINSTEGVLFVEMAALSDDLTYKMISLSDGSTTNRISVIFNNTSSNTIRVVIVNYSVSFDETYTVTSILDFNKIAVKYKENDFALWINGTEVAIDTSGAVPINLNKLSFDIGNGTYHFYGKVRQLQVYPTALSDSELTILTTP